MVRKLLWMLTYLKVLNVFLIFLRVIAAIFLPLVMDDCWLEIKGN